MSDILPSVPADAAPAPAAPEPRANAHPRFAGIDALRGLAALVVVLSHAVENATPFLADGSWARRLIEALTVEYLNFGKIGVVAFFMISGFVVPFSFTHRRPVASFLVTRFFRLYPAYWLSIVGAVATAPFVLEAMPPARQVLANVTMIQPLFRQPDLLGPYWTLFYELIFYGACLVAFLIGRLRSPWYCLTIVAGLSALGLGIAVLRGTGHGHGLPIGLPMYLAVMHLGTLARFAQLDETPDARRCFHLGLAIVLATAGPISAIGFEQHAGHQRMIADVTSIYAGMLAFLALRHGRIGVGRVTLFLGSISYSLYLFHPLCLNVVTTWALAHPAPWSVGLVLLAVPVSSILLATAVERLVETPANRFGKRIRKALAPG